MATRGYYNNKPASPDTVKKTVEFEGMTVRVDRPKGFVMEGEDGSGKTWRRVYQYDYGFIPRTQGGDGDGLDVFLGPHEKDADDAYWVVQKKDDGSFDEYKVFLGFKSRADAKKAYEAHIPKKYFGGMIAMSVQMMRSMLGKDPSEKLAMAVMTRAFDEELSAIHGSG